MPSHTPPIVQLPHRRFTAPPFALRAYVIFLIALLQVLPGEVDAQRNAARYFDVIRLTSGRDVKGKILEYTYGERVVMLAIDGDVEEFNWGRIKRVEFKVDRDYGGAGDDTQAGSLSATNSVEQTPQRNWLHDITVGGLFGVQLSEFTADRNDLVIGYGISYAHLRRYRSLRYGGGLEYAVYHYRRGEASLSLFAVVEGPLTFGASPRVAPYFRFAAGPALPTGVPNSDGEITSRVVGLLVHPTAGIEFKTSGNDYNNVYVDLGYRFLKSQFTVTSPTLDVLERSVNYSRFSWRVGFRF